MVRDLSPSPEDIIAEVHPSIPSGCVFTTLTAKFCVRSKNLGAVWCTPLDREALDGNPAML